MNTIPEGKEMIWSEATYKEPIEGIPYSNVGLTVGRAIYIPEGMKGQEKLLDEAVDRLAKEKFAKLKEDILTTRNEMLDEIRVELEKKYGKTIEDLQEEIKILKLKNK